MGTIFRLNVILGIKARVEDNHLVGFREIDAGPSSLGGQHKHGRLVALGAELVDQILPLSDFRVAVQAEVRKRFSLKNKLKDVQDHDKSTKDQSLCTFRHESAQQLEHLLHFATYEPLVVVQGKFLDRCILITQFVQLHVRVCSQFCQDEVRVRLCPFVLLQTGLCNLG